MIRLSKEQILLLHHAVIERYGGVHGIRDENMLDSAINAPFQSFGDQDLFPTVIEKSVRLGYGLVKNHPFIDGNKRIGALSMLTLLDLNHLSLDSSNEELASVFLCIAEGTLDLDGLLKWVMNKII